MAWGLAAYVIWACILLICFRSENSPNSHLLVDSLWHKISEMVANDACALIRLSIDSLGDHGQCWQHCITSLTQYQAGKQFSSFPFILYLVTCLTGILEETFISYGHYKIN